MLAAGPCSGDMQLKRSSTLAPYSTADKRNTKLASSARESEGNEVASLLSCGWNLQRVGDCMRRRLGVSFRADEYGIGCRNYKTGLERRSTKMNDVYRGRA